MEYTKLTTRFSTNFVGQVLLSNVKKKINSCLIRNRVKRLRRKEGYMLINPWPHQLLEVISIDYIAELPNAPRGYNHMLVIKDYFAKFLKLYAAKCVVDYSLDYGIPLKLLSDQDQTYESELFQQVMKNLGIKKLGTNQLMGLQNKAILQQRTI